MIHPRLAYSDKTFRRPVQKPLKRWRSKREKYWRDRNRFILDGQLFHLGYAVACRGADILETNLCVAGKF
ncbi:hypothetical protein TNCT_542111 [Trichonephila clavata]|uniref:Uncharacterized protein n=1 Tax=Trichonephila clavata TaxID=2740835 RepID=A0A8X6FHJ3_TRICU|nr:hypothetical protein TNCT_542111 [Trichonephila clavata]